MKKVVLKALNIEEGEGTSVLLLLIQSVFIGVFVATFEVGATTLMKENFPTSEIAKAYLISGIVGLVLTSIFSRLQSSISFSKLAIINLIVVTLIGAGMWYGLSVSENKTLSFLLFVFFGPLMILLGLGFWGIVARMYTLRQGKRIFGMIDSGQVLGTIIAGFAIPSIQLFLPKTKDLLLVSVAGAICALLLQFILSSKYKDKLVLQTTGKEEMKAARADSSFSTLLKSRFIRYMAIFVIISMIVQFFVQTTLLFAAFEKYKDPKEFAVFMGQLISALMIFTFLVKTFVYSTILKNYGLKVSLLILPVLLVLFTGIGALVGTFMGTQVDSAGFIFYFLLLSLNKLFAGSLRGSIELPSFKILYQPLDKSIKYDVQSKIDGVVNEIAALTAGGVLAIFGLIKFPGVGYLYVMLALLVAWFMVGVKLYEEYQNTLRNSLSNIKSKGSEQKTKANKLEIKDVLHEELKSDETDKVIYTLRLAEKVEPILYKKSIIDFFNSSTPRLREYSINKAAENKIYLAKEQLQKVINTSASDATKSLASNALKQLNENYETSLSLERITRLVKSKNPEERESIAKILSSYTDEKYVPFLIELIRDVEPKVRLAAIDSASQSKAPELLPYLIDNISINQYNNAATATLISYQESALDKLDQSFYKSGYDTPTLIRIVNIMGLIGGEKAKELLANKINYPNAIIELHALSALNACGYQATGMKVNRILQAIDANIGNTAWNLAATQEVNEETEIGKFLAEALQDELKQNYEHIFLLLSLAYDPQSISNIRENIESGTSEGIGFAIELLDLFLAEDLKAKLFPIFEDVPLVEKLNRLQVNYAREKLNAREILTHIINRDYGHVNRWTKVCAIYSFLTLEDKEVTDDLIAQLFNPDTLLRETAAWVIYSIDPYQYEQCAKRIEVTHKIELDNSIARAKMNIGTLLIEKAICLKKVKQFKKIEGLVLSDMVQHIEVLSLKNNQVLMTKTDASNDALYIILEGEMELKNNLTSLKKFSQNQLIGPMLIIDSDIENTSIVSVGETTLYRINMNKIYDLIYKHCELANAIINTINQRLYVEEEIVHEMVEMVN